MEKLDERNDDHNHLIDIKSGNVINLQTKKLKNLKKNS